MPRVRHTWSCVCIKVTGVPLGVKSPLVPRRRAPTPVAYFTKSYQIYTIDQILSPGLGPSDILDRPCLRLREGGGLAQGLGNKRRGGCSRITFCT